jgi:hypothetical protein
LPGFFLPFKEINHQSQGLHWCNLGSYLLRVSCYPRLLAQKNPTLHSQSFLVSTSTGDSSHPPSFHCRILSSLLAGLNPPQCATFLAHLAQILEREREPFERARGGPNGHSQIPDPSHFCRASPLTGAYHFSHQPKLERERMRSESSPHLGPPPKCPPNLAAANFFASTIFSLAIPNLTTPHFNLNLGHLSLIGMMFLKDTYPQPQVPIGYP